MQPQQHQDWILGMYLQNVSAGFGLAMTLILAVLVVPSVQAQTFSVLYTFSGGPDGANPEAGVIQDPKGRLYGTASRDGKSCGVVFKLTLAGMETPLHTFGQQGCQPMAGLVRDTAGNLYGTTVKGGTYQKGVVFKLAPNGKYTVLHKFGASDDGAYPVTGLILGSGGNLYGTTQYGGDLTCQNSNGMGCGTVFRLSRWGKETVLHRFHGKANDGATPLTGLVQDSAGNLYGATECTSGSLGCHLGVFKLTPTRKLTVLNTRDGVRGLTLDAGGNLYGTGVGGTGNCFGGNGCGVVFKLDTSTGQETVLYSFQGVPDGEGPLGGVIRDSAGNLYGTTQLGGTSSAGTVFKVDSNGIETVLHSFEGPDGGDPISALTMDAKGNLYGTTPVGGAAGCNQNGCGVVFKIAP